MIVDKYKFLPVPFHTFEFRIRDVAGETLPLAPSIDVEPAKFDCYHDCGSGIKYAIMLHCYSSILMKDGASLYGIHAACGCRRREKRIFSLLQSVRLLKKALFSFPQTQFNLQASAALLIQDKAKKAPC